MRSSVGNRLFEAVRRGRHCARAYSTEAAFGGQELVLRDVFVPCNRPGELVVLGPFDSSVSRMEPFGFPRGFATTSLGHLRCRFSHPLRTPVHVDDVDELKRYQPWSCHFSLFISFASLESAESS